MIYYLDEKESDHSLFLCKILTELTKTSISLIEVSPFSTIGDIVGYITDLIKTVQSSDIVLCPWAIPGNHRIDTLFEELAEKCWVVTAAGNNSGPIEELTPARVKNVITVGALNKSGVKASHSNYSNEKKLKWVIGTNYCIDGVSKSGTSISATVYTAFLFEAVRQKDFSLVEQLNKEYTARNSLSTQ